MPIPFVVEPGLKPATVKAGEANAAIVDANPQATPVLARNASEAGAPWTWCVLDAVLVVLEPALLHRDAFLGAEVGSAQHRPSSSSRMRASCSRSWRWAS